MPSPPQSASAQAGTDIFIRRVIDLLMVLRTTQRQAFEDAAALVANAWNSGGRLMIARTHHTLHTELINRASGPLGVLVLEADDVPHESEVTELPNLRSGDVVLIHSNAGTTAKTVSIAQLAKDRGVPTIALTQMPFETSASVQSRHLSGQRLHEVADVTIDLGGDVGDGVVHVDGIDVPVAPTSGVTGVAAAWMLIVRACEKVVETGKIPLILEGIQLPGAESRNSRLLQLWHESGLPYSAE